MCCPTLVTEDLSACVATTCSWSAEAAVENLYCQSPFHFHSTPLVCFLKEEKQPMMERQEIILWFIDVFQSCLKLLHKPIEYVLDHAKKICWNLLINKIIGFFILLRENYGQSFFMEFVRVYKKNGIEEFFTGSLHQSSWFYCFGCYILGFNFLRVSTFLSQQPCAS